MEGKSLFRRKGLRNVTDVATNSTINYLYLTSYGRRVSVFQLGMNNCKHFNWW